MLVKTEHPIIDRTDGVSIALADWRFNLRGSNTEPLLRLNIETKCSKALLAAKMREIRQSIRNEVTQ